MPRRSVEERALAFALNNPPGTHTLEPGPGLKPSNPKAALRRCCAAWQRAFDAYMATKKGDNIDRMFATGPASEAYCNAMPMLVGYEGVRDFLACAAHGILIGAIPQDRAGQLLYAAQVALATLHHAPKPAPIPAPVPVRTSAVPHPLPLKNPTFDELFPIVTSTESKP
jgi:hypothetical protein